MSALYPFPDVSKATVFPYPENSQLEFKQSYVELREEKLWNTICAFLNSSGGYLVLGVSDDRKICGVLCDKKLDRFLLNVDNAFHQRKIHTVEGEPLDLGTIKADILPAASNKHICVVTVIPVPGYTYQLLDGSIYHRLSASNYRQTARREYYTIDDIHAARNSERDAARQKFMSLQEDYNVLVGAAKDAENRARHIESMLTTLTEETRDLRALLYEDILQRKAAAESALRRRHLSFCSDAEKLVDLRRDSFWC